MRVRLSCTMNFPIYNRPESVDGEVCRTVFPDDQVDVSLNSSPFPPRGEQPRRPPRPRCLTVIRPDTDLSPCLSATSGVLVGHINARSCCNKEDDIVELTDEENLGHSLHH